MADGNGKKKVLITGGAGLIGSVLIDRLGDRYELSSLDLREAVGVPSHVASLDDLDAMQPAFAGIDSVVHLAADRAAYAEWDSVLPNNLVGTYNVFEASRREGVKRVIFASSNHATGGFYRDEPWSLVGSGQFDKLEAGAYPLVDEDVMIRPDGFYGVSKAFGEAIGSYYNDYHGVSSIHLRIGWVISSDDPTFSRSHCHFGSVTATRRRLFSAPLMRRRIFDTASTMRRQTTSGRSSTLAAQRRNWDLHRKMVQAASSLRGQRQRGISSSPNFTLGEPSTLLARVLP